MKICKYRHCDKDISEMRQNALFCTRKCKSMESTYVLRHKKFIENCVNEEMKVVELVKFIKGTYKI